MFRHKIDTIVTTGPDSTLAWAGSLSAPLTRVPAHLVQRSTTLHNTPEPINLTRLQFRAQNLSNVKLLGAKLTSSAAVNSITARRCLFSSLLFSRRVPETRAKLPQMERLGRWGRSGVSLGGSAATSPLVAELVLRCAFLSQTHARPSKLHRTTTANIQFVEFPILLHTHYNWYDRRMMEETTEETEHINET